MKIIAVKAYRVELPLHEGSYNWSGGKSVSVFDCTVVAVETDAGLVGHGEVCPLGPSTCRPMPRACGRACASSGRTCSARPASSAGSTAAWTRRSRATPTSSRRSTSPAGTSSARRRACRSARCSAGVRRGLRPLPRHLAGEPGRHGGQGRRLPRRGLPPVPAQGRRRPRRDIARIRAVAADARARATAWSPTPTPAG